MGHWRLASLGHVADAASRFHRSTAVQGLPPCVPVAIALGVCLGPASALPGFALETKAGRFVASCACLALRLIPPVQGALNRRYPVN